MAEFRKLEQEVSMAVNEEIARRDQSLSAALGRADEAAKVDVSKTRPIVQAPSPSYSRAGPSIPAEEEHRHLSTERALLHGLFEAKLLNGDRTFELADVQMTHELEAMAKLIVGRRHGRPS